MNNLASNSLANALRAVGLFHSFAADRKIDLNARLEAGEILSLTEIEAFVDRCRIRGNGEERPSARSPQLRGKILGTEHYRAKLKPGHEEQVSTGWIATRLLYTRNYLIWLTEDRILKLSTAEPIRQKLRFALQSLIKAINSRMPTAAESQTPRQGLAKEELDTIEDAIRPESSRNPWQGEHAKFRNEAMITLYKELGSRRGELAGLEIPDVNFRTGRIQILRKPDNPTDPRRDQPNTKTWAIEQRLEEKTLRLIESYVHNYRANIPGARKHKFVFVASRTGRPLSNPAINKIFRELRDG